MAVAKIGRLFEKFLEEKCATRVEDCLKKLLTQLQLDDSTESKSSFSEWLVSAVTNWSASGVQPPPHVISFTLNLTALLAANEDRFNELNKNNFFIKLVKISKARQPDAPSSVKLAYIELLSSFLQHTSGVDWMVVCNYWADIYNWSLKDSDQDVILKSTIFLEALLEKTVNHDQNFCDNVVRRIMLPLSENIYRCVKVFNLMTITDDVAYHCLQPTLKLAGNILEYFLTGVCFRKKDFKVPLLFLKNFHLEEQICDFMVMAQNKCLVFQLSRIMFIMQFLELYGKVITKSVTSQQLDCSVNRIRSNFTTNLYREHYSELLTYCRFGFLFWKLMDDKIPSSPLINTKKKPIQFGDQLVLMTTFPHFCLLVKHCFSIGDAEEMYDNDEIRSAFIDKIMKMMSYEFMRVCFYWRKRFIENFDTFEVCRHCLQIVKDSRDYISRKQAIIIFQVLVYFVKDVINSSKKSQEKLEIFAGENSYFIKVFEVMSILIEEFQFGLRDCIEATDVMDLAFDFLALTERSSEMIVQVIKLINIAVVYNMAPHMALLVENNTDTLVYSLGPFLYAKLIGKDPKVKAAALEVVCTATRISNKSKFVL